MQLAITVVVIFTFEFIHEVPKSVSFVILTIFRLAIVALGRAFRSTLGLYRAQLFFKSGFIELELCVLILKLGKLCLELCYQLSLSKYLGIHFIDRILESDYFLFILSLLLVYLVIQSLIC